MKRALAQSTRFLLMAAMVLATVITGNEPRAAHAPQAPDGARVKYHPSPRVRVVPNIIFARYGKRSLRLDFIFQ